MNSISPINWYSSRGKVNAFDFRVGKDFYSYAEKHGLLIGRKEVCAGPGKIIQQFIDQIIQSTHYEERNSSLEEIIDFCFLHQMMESISLIYEIARCASWHRFPDQDDTRGNTASASRHAVPNCNLARELSTRKNPIAEKILDAHFGMYWNMHKYEEIYKSTMNIKQYTKSLVSNMGKNTNSFREDWNGFDEKMLILIDKIDKKLSDILGLAHSEFSYKKSDLSVFYGVPYYPSY